MESSHNSPAAETTVTRSGTKSSKPTTNVNGIGMFDSWKRNFKSPFFAMLDIIDNAIDAGFDDNHLGTFDGRVDIYENFIPNSSTAVPDQVSSFGSGADSSRRGKSKMEEKRSELVIVNNSIVAICPLEQILEIHRSAKGSLSESIGENGVGECFFCFNHDGSHLKFYF